MALSRWPRSFQRLAFQSAVPQLVPKRYLGHAMGITQLTNGFALLLVPLFAAGLLAAIGLRRHPAARRGQLRSSRSLTLLLVRFPDLLGWRPRERLLAAIVNGLRYSWRHRGFRLMLRLLRAGQHLPGPGAAAGHPAGAVLRHALDAGRPRSPSPRRSARSPAALLMALWGGPRHRRMLGVLIGNLGTARRLRRSSGCDAVRRR